MRKLLLMLAVLALLGCAREETVTKGSPSVDIDLPYYGQATLKERILGAEVIARVRLRSVEALGTFVPGSSGSEYLPALDFTFDALEYLHGSGGGTLVARAYGYIDDGSWVFPTVAEAEETARTEVMDFRDKRWDGREAIVFLRRPLKGGEPYRLGSIGSDWHAEEGRVLFSKLTVADDKYQAWLPDASVPGASGGEQRFLLDDPGSGVSSVSTITLSSLKFRIAELGGTASGYEGETDEVRRCLAFKSLQERRIAAEKAAGTFGSVYLYDVESGMAAGTPVYKSESPEIRRLFPDAGLPAHEEFGGERASRYGGGWFSGSANELFRALQVHHTTTEGVYIAGPSLHTRRPLPSGEYRTYYNFRYALGPDCGYSSRGSDEEFKLVITVTSPRGTLAESFFDPYADGAAVTGTTTAGTIRWESGRVEAALTVDVSDHVLYFIGLDGTVTLSLAVDDATEASGTLRWTVATQPWSAGDKLMLRIRGIGCQGGVAVADSANNPGLVSDCDALLEARDVLAVTGTLNWDVDTAMTRWDGVTVGGTPRRVTGLVLFQHVLGGSIPPVLGELTGLERLELSANGLTGEIPWQLGDLTNLRTLHLPSNGLTGEIPPELGRLSNLTVLWLQGNELTGWMPRELGDMSSLEDLGLAGNRLEGTIRPELGNLTHLRQLWAYDNQLGGEIPPELGKLTELRQLELQDNLLGGQIPLELAGLANLSTLKLSGNRLGSCIPSSLYGVMSNDLGELGLPDCSEVPTPTGLSVSLKDGTFSISWTALPDATRYEVQHRIAGDDDRWSGMDITVDTAVAYSPDDGPVCGSTYEFRVRAYVFGLTYASWSAASDAESVTTEECDRDSSAGHSPIVEKAGMSTLAG